MADNDKNGIPPVVIAAFAVVALTIIGLSAYALLPRNPHLERNPAEFCDCFEQAFKQHKTNIAKGVPTTIEKDFQGCLKSTGYSNPSLQTWRDAIRLCDLKENQPPGQRGEPGE